MIQRLFEDTLKIVSDMQDHVSILNSFARGCDHVTELGTRSMVSTWAFLEALRGTGGTVVSIDLVDPIRYGISHQVVSKNCLNEGVNFKFILGDSTKIEIDPTDFLLIDTDHTKEQLTKELALHASKVRKIIAFHDTLACPELRETIQDFLQNNPSWQLLMDYTAGSGITLIKRLN